VRLLCIGEGEEVSGIFTPAAPLYLIAAIPRNIRSHGRRQAFDHSRLRARDRLLPKLGHVRAANDGQQARLSISRGLGDVFRGYASACTGACEGDPSARAAHGFQGRFCNAVARLAVVNPLAKAALRQFSKARPRPGRDIGNGTRIFVT